MSVQIVHLHTMSFASVPVFVVYVLGVVCQQFNQLYKYFLTTQHTLHYVSMADIPTLPL